MRVLIAGIGNVFLGDDGFGVAVAERLRSRQMPEGVDVVDFGIRGIDLAYALEDYDAAILVDVVSRGGPPGTLYVLDPQLPSAGAAPEMHAMTPDRVLRWVSADRIPAAVRIVGCEPATFGAEGIGHPGLSDEVQAAVGEAVRAVDEIVSEFLGWRVAHA